MWQSSANCNEEDHGLFFSQARGKMDMAIKICKPCPVKGECLKFAMDENIEHGIYGGLTPTQRKGLVNAR
jgi:hypothetical protein